MFNTAAAGLAFRCGSQVRQRLLHQEHRPAQVHLVGLGQCLDGHLTKRLGQRVGSVVDHHVDASELGNRSLH
jgi:hypothetical protein